MTVKYKLSRLKEAGGNKDSGPGLVIGRKLFVPGPYGWGVVAAVHGADDNATFDVLFNDLGVGGEIPGLELLGVSRAELVGMACTVSEELVSARTIGARITASCRRAAETDALVAAYDAKVAALRSDPAYAFLVQGSDDTGRLAAQNLSALLSREFPGVAFTIKATGRMLRTVWTDGPDVGAVEAFTARFNAGHVLNDNAAWCEVFGSAPISSAERVLSDAALDKAIEVVWEINALAAQRPTVVQFRARQLPRVAQFSPIQLETAIRRSVSLVSPMLKEAA